MFNYRKIFFSNIITRVYRYSRYILIFLSAFLYFSLLSFTFFRDYLHIDFLGISWLASNLMNQSTQAFSDGFFPFGYPLLLNLLGRIIPYANAAKLIGIFSVSLLCLIIVKLWDNTFNMPKKHIYRDILLIFFTIDNLLCRQWID